MGFIDIDDAENDPRIPHYLKRIKSALARRGLVPDLEDSEWEIHGPHQDMNYHVLIGWAQDKKCEWYCVAIYPNAVYEIDDPDDWWKVSNENRIPVGSKRYGYQNWARPMEAEP